MMMMMMMMMMKIPLKSSGSGVLSWYSHDDQKMMMINPTSITRSELWDPKTS